jgi:hypothetical protein
MKVMQRPEQVLILFSQHKTVTAFIKPQDNVCHRHHCHNLQRSVYSFPLTYCEIHV